MSSLKDLYRNKKKGTLVNKYLPPSSPESLSNGIESSEHLSALQKKKNYFLPPIDYSKPENFVRFGSAYQYYTNAFDYITSYYPYDGSGYEKTNFYNEINPLEKYTLDVIYPRSTGFVTNGVEYGTIYSNSVGYYSSSLDQYIQIKGGPHIGTKYDADKNRTSNLEFGGPSGSTVEFFLQKNELIDSGSQSPNQVIFDLTNGQSDTSADDYGRLRIELVSGSETQFRVTMLSGNSGFDNVLVPSTAGQITISDGTWRNFGFVFDTSNNVGLLDFYLNGVCIETGIQSNGAGAKVVNEVTGTMIGNIGALRQNPTGSLPATYEGAGKLSASLDEFRFWKTKRTSEQIGRYWFDNVNGGSDKYDANVSLGVYYKFNEGITQTASLDQVVLDYSGRVSNGLYVGYDANYSRNTGSAIDQQNITSVTERGDPIVRSTNPTLSSTKASYQHSGSRYDYENNARLLNHLPAWIIEEEEKADNEIEKITQIISSYFDTIYNQVTALRELKYNKYISGSLTNSIDEFPYNDRLIENLGIDTPELFENIGILEQFMQRDESINFDQHLEDIKNSIYKNVYNNLSYILKSKGNEKAIRNFIRCFGVGEEVITLNSYSNDADYEISSSYLSTVSEKKYIDFSSLSTSTDADATVYQYYDSSISNSSGLISSSLDLDQYAFTLQAEFLFPDKQPIYNTSNQVPQVVSSSLFGFHNPKVLDGTSNDLTWPDSINDDYGLQIYAVKSPGEFSEITSPTHKVKDAFFVVKNRAGDTLLTSSIYRNVYENKKWNLSLTLKPTKYPFSDSVLGTAVGTSEYELQLYGVNYDLGQKKHSFSETTTVTYTTGSNLLSNAKRVYAGAHRTNFTGSVEVQTDVRVSSVRYWSDFLSTDILDLQAKETDTHGVLHPSRNPYLFQTGSITTYTPSIQTLALNWEFSDITTSDASGRFTVLDLSSGSADSEYIGNYQGSVLSDINLRQHPGRGDFFTAYATPAKKQYVYSEKLLPLEYISSTEMVKVMSNDDQVFGTYKKPASSFYAIEKSMYRGISNRMLHLFASIKEFNNLVGEPVNKYRMNYKKMEKLREIFFRKVRNETIDLEKYLQYYKWLDSAVGDMIQQMFPISARYAPNVRNVVESHTLERNKIQHKPPIIKYAYPWGVGASGPIANIGGSYEPMGVAGDPNHPSSFPPQRPLAPNGYNSDVNNLGGNRVERQQPPREQPPSNAPSRGFGPDPNAGQPQVRDDRENGNTPGLPPNDDFNPNIGGI
jgi:hypothetical protein